LEIFQAKGRRRLRAGVRTYILGASKQTVRYLCGSSGGIEEKDLVAGVDLKPK